MKSLPFAKKFHEIWFSLMLTKRTKDYKVEF